MRTIVEERDGLQYIAIATQETTREKIAKLANRAGILIDRVLFPPLSTELPAPTNNPDNH